MTTVKRRMAMLVAVSAVSGVMTMFSPTTSAQAVPHEVCTGIGNAVLSSPFVYPESLNGPAGTTNFAASSAHSATFSFSLDTPANGCQPSGTDIHATGTVHGWCGFSIGSGTTNKGDQFHWVGVGGNLVVTGEVEGAGRADADIFAGETCVNHVPGADRFIVDVAVVRQSCTLVNTPSQSTTTFSLGDNTSVNAGPASVHATGNSFRAHAAGTSFSANVRPHGHFSVQTSVCA